MMFDLVIFYVMIGCIVAAATLAGVLSIYSKELTE